MQRKEEVKRRDRREKGASRVMTAFEPELWGGHLDYSYYVFKFDKQSLSTRARERSLFRKVPVPSVSNLTVNLNPVERTLSSDTVPTTKIQTFFLHETINPFPNMSRPAIERVPWTCFNPLCWCEAESRKVVSKAVGL